MHPRIKSCYSEVSVDCVEDLAKEMAFRSPQERSEVKRRLEEDEEVGEGFVELVMKRCQEKAFQDGKSIPDDDLESGKTQCLGNYEQMAEDMYGRAEKLAAELEADPAILHARSNREEINRIIRANQSGATHYEVLGLQSTATERDVIKAVRRCSVMVHPDKNDDKEAEECFKGEFLCERRAQC